MTAKSKQGELTMSIAQKCSVDGCGLLSKYYVKGYCNSHYKRLLRYGNALSGKRPHENTGMSGTPTYTSWQKMKTRCMNKSDKHYSYYGGRGVKVCDRWVNSFANFLADMGERPQGETLDRIDPNGDYEPSNCRWSTRSVQSRNTRASQKTSTGHRGVTVVKSTNKFAAAIYVNNKKIHLGHYHTVNNAIKARKEAEEKYWNK